MEKKIVFATLKKKKLKELIKSDRFVAELLKSRFHNQATISVHFKSKKSVFDGGNKNVI